MKKIYIDNIRWMTVVIVVIYHVFYTFNGVVTSGVIGPFTSIQYQDCYLYFVYPWFMLLLLSKLQASGGHSVTGCRKEEYKIHENRNRKIEFTNI